MHHHHTVRFLQFGSFTLAILLFLVFVGGLVRSTGSGMGCPDWPKCYGYWVPPDDPAQLSHVEGRHFSKRQMIIRNDTLWVATSSFTATGEFNYHYWKKYPKHNYARFDATETRIEYLNRLLGAITGLLVLTVVILSLPLRVVNKNVFRFSMLLLLITGYQGWLGSVVVASHLAPYKITAHMALALIIVLLMIYLLFLAAKGSGRPRQVIPRNIRILTIATLFLGIMQAILGTQVRQEVDSLMKLMPLADRQTWVDQLGGILVSHKNLAMGTLLLNVVLFFRMKKTPVPEPVTRLQTFVLLTLALEFSAGLALNYLQLPVIIQPLHLVLANIMVGLQFYLVLNTRKQ